MKARTLDADIPELREYLRPGARVLDVGCGSGSITLDVAAAVYPGQVTGIDPGERSICAARESAEQAGRRVNVTFVVGDSHRLDFPDRTFDLVYSHTVIHFFLDPIGGLKEQRRVTKDGGRVVASGVRDHIPSLRYPACPNWDKVCEAIQEYTRSLLSRFRESGEDPTTYARQQARENPTTMSYYDMHSGRKCVEWFSKADLIDLRFSVKSRVQYQGSPEMGPRGCDFLVLDEPQNATERQTLVWMQQMVRDGFLSEEILQHAKEESRAWHKDARAFHFWPEVFAAGRRKPSPTEEKNL